VLSTRRLLNLRQLLDNVFCEESQYRKIVPSYKDTTDQDVFVCIKLTSVPVLTKTRYYLR